MHLSHDLVRIRELLRTRPPGAVLEVRCLSLAESRELASQLLEVECRDLRFSWVTAPAAPPLRWVLPLLVSGCALLFPFLRQQDPVEADPRRSGGGSLAAYTLAAEPRP